MRTLSFLRRACALAGRDWGKRQYIYISLVNMENRLEAARKERKERLRRYIALEDPLKNTIGAEIMAR